MLCHALAICLTTLSLAAPDLLPRGSRRGVDRIIGVEAAALAEHCCVAYVVKPGDSFMKIAKQQLGAVKRWSEITALNPDVNPLRIRVGDSLWLPPKKLAAAKAEPTFAFLHENWHFDGLGKPFAPAAEVHASRYGELGFVLVPKRHLAAYKAACKKQWHELHALALAGKVQELTTRCSRSSVDEKSSIYRIRDTITFARDEKGRFAVSTKTVYYGKDGKVVPLEMVKDAAKVVGKRKESALLLLLVALGGGAWLLLRRREGAVLVATA